MKKYIAMTFKKFFWWWICCYVIVLLTYTILGLGTALLISYFMG